MTPEEPGRHDGPGEVLDQVHQPLLDRITRGALDEDYQHVAERKRARQAAGIGPKRERSPLARRGVFTAVVVGAFGVLASVSAVQTAENADVASASRATLIDRITSVRSTVDDQQGDISTVRAANTALTGSNDEVRSETTRMTSRADTLATETGFEEMRGDGVVAVVDDAPGGGDGLVRDRDLRLLVNGLWEAGARGIAINGQRVTSLSALRNSWQAVRINDVSLSPPYRVSAVGDQDVLQARFAETTSGLRFQDLTTQLGMPYSMDNADGLELPAAPDRVLDLRKVRLGGAEDSKHPVDNEESP
ncbi:DUF881 domain-containing protein [Nocardioides insulae]|uniref:DUF881 domain-containing protein n=1 Tax=Nocardioides insulae TaxID=394734 RepID=UPI0003FEBBD6|nr:DUF881 domain-containing protein [Nocardioides insulae]